MCSVSEKIVSPLLAWYAQNRRELPWRKDREPYHVWLSEIMLQQTRVEAVKGYYARFLQALPTVEALAECDADLLKKLWEGLGYYSRVRNLQKAAKIIVGQYHGKFPENYDEIRALPGIGDYTAGAIGSICFGLKTPAVDGNVLRVLSRLLDDHRDVLSAQVKREYREALEKIYPAEDCGSFTQALMELGAGLCGPNCAPQCDICPIRQYCLARERKTAQQLPVKAPKKEKREEEKTVFVLDCGGSIAVRRRPETGLLAGLWELPNIDGFLSAQEAVELAAQWQTAPKELLRSVERVHIFTHIRWKMRCYFISCRQMPDGFVWADAQQRRKEIALPTAFRMFLE